jgi:TolB protein
MNFLKSMKRLIALFISFLTLFSLRCGVQPDEALRSLGSPGYLQEVGIEKVLLTDTKEGVRHLYVLDNRSGSARRLTTAPMRRSGVWSPDGRLIAYREVDEDGSNNSLNVMREDGTGVRRLVNYPTGPRIFLLKWSPDGSRIAFRVGPPTMAVHIIRPDGTGLTTIEALGTPTEVANLQGGFAWSPDGRALAYEAKYSEDAVPQLYFVNADGTGRRRLTGAPSRAESPSWSPDGRQVAFESGSQIYVVNADGTGQRQVWGGPALDPVWSPRGDAIAYRPPFGGLEVVSPDGSGRRQIVGRNGGDFFLTSWSPDGGRIAYLWVSGARTSLYVVTSTGDDIRRLVDDVGSFDLKWSR